MEERSEILVIVSAVILVIAVGTYAYHEIENWSWLDSAYFSVATLTTIGDNTHIPTTNGSKVFTMVYAIFGIGVMLSSMTVIASIYLTHHKNIFERRIYSTTDRVSRAVESIHKNVTNLTAKEKETLLKIIKK